MTTYVKGPDLDPFEIPEDGKWHLTKDHKRVVLHCMDCPPACCPVERLPVEAVSMGSNQLPYRCVGCGNMHIATLDGWTVVPLPPEPTP